jgi:peroxiredoxin
MMTAIKARLTTPHLSASRALRGGMLSAALLALLLVILFRACAPSTTTTRLSIGKRASAFALAAEQAGVRSPAQATFAPGNARPTLLIFFYTLCTHCLLEMQSARDVTGEFTGLRTVYIDSPAERANLPDMMMQRLGIADPVLLDTDGHVAARYGVAYYPALVLVDGQGIVRDIWTGETGAAILRAGIQQALTTPGSR